MMQWDILPYSAVISAIKQKVGKYTNILCYPITKGIDRY